MLKTKSVWSPINRKTDGLRILADPHSRARPAGISVRRVDGQSRSKRATSTRRPGWRNLVGAVLRRNTERAVPGRAIDKRSRTIKNHGQKFTLRLVKKLAQRGRVTLHVSLRVRISRSATGTPAETHSQQPGVATCRTGMILCDGAASIHYCRELRRPSHALGVDATTRSRLPSVPVFDLQDRGRCAGHRFPPRGRVGARADAVDADGDDGYRGDIPLRRTSLNGVRPSQRLVQ